MSCIFPDQFLVTINSPLRVLGAEAKPLCETLGGRPYRGQQPYWRIYGKVTY